MYVKLVFIESAVLKFSRAKAGFCNDASNLQVRYISSLQKKKKKKKKILRVLEVSIWN